jgi:hypothetical protein
MEVGDLAVILPDDRGHQIQGDLALAIEIAPALRWEIEICGSEWLMRHFCNGVPL